MSDKTTSIDEAVATLRSGMTIGIGGWGSRRKPMALVRAILRSPLRNLTIVSYAGPDVGLLLASGQATRVVTGFASLDSIALEPHFRRARQAGTVELTELDEGMLHWGLLAAAHRLTIHHDLLAAEQFGVLIGARWSRPDGDVGGSGQQGIQHLVRAGVFLQVELDVGKPAPPSAQHRN